MRKLHLLLRKFILGMACFTWACNKTELSNVTFYVVANSTESVTVSMGPEQFGVRANVPAVMSSLKLPVDNCYRTSTGPSCTNYWSGFVNATTAPSKNFPNGEAVSQFCTFYSTRQGSIEVSRSNGANGVLRIQCF